MLFAIIMLVIGVLLGGYIYHWLLFASFNKDPVAVLRVLDGKNRKEINKDNRDFAELEIEQHGNSIMAWFKETGVFVSQGATIQEVIDIAHVGIQCA